jgi:hypothetical protein
MPNSWPANPVGSSAKPVKAAFVSPPLPRHYLVICEITVTGITATGIAATAQYIQTRTF